MKKNLTPSRPYENVAVIGALGVVGQSVVHQLKRLNVKPTLLDNRNGHEVGSLRFLENYSAVYYCAPVNSDYWDISHVLSQWFTMHVPDDKIVYIIIRSTLPLGASIKLVQTLPLNCRLIYLPEFSTDQQLRSFVPETPYYSCIQRLPDYPFWVPLTEASSNNIPVMPLLYLSGFKPTWVLPTQLEAIKLLANSYRANAVNMANFADSVCQRAGIEYADIRPALMDQVESREPVLKAPTLTFGGKCLPNTATLLGRRVMSNVSDTAGLNNLGFVFGETCRACMRIHDLLVKYPQKITPAIALVGLKDTVGSTSRVSINSPAELIWNSFKNDHAACRLPFIFSGPADLVRCLDKVSTNLVSKERQALGFEHVQFIILCQPDHIDGSIDMRYLLPILRQSTQFVKYIFNLGKVKFTNQDIMTIAGYNGVFVFEQELATRKPN